MRFGLYARKSNEQEGEGIERSVEFQLDFCRREVARLGGEVAAEHVDDGLSGALFETRPGLQALLRDARARRFDAVGVYTRDRLSRDARDYRRMIEDLSDIGVSVRELSTGEVEDVSTFQGRIIGGIKAEIAQQYKDEARRKTADKMRALAEDGRWLQPAPFGYRKKGKHDLEVHEEEARIIREEIAEPFAAGLFGIHEIARRLNESRIPAPRAGAWSASNVRQILKRPTFRGTYVYGKTKMHYRRELGERAKKADGGAREKGFLAQPESKWIVVPKPEWTIIGMNLAERIDARFASMKPERIDVEALRREAREIEEALRAPGADVEDLEERLARVGEKVKPLRPERAKGKYLLSGGMLRCPSCGHSFEARHGSSWGGKGVYVCASRRKRPGSCSNRLVLPIAATDDAVLSVIEEEILGTRYLDGLLATVAAPPSADSREILERERGRLSASVDRLVDAIADGTIPKDKARPKVAALEAELAKIEAELQRPRPEPVDVEKLRATLEARAATWREELRKSPDLARIIIRRMIGPITLHDAPPQWIVDKYGKGGTGGLTWEAEARPEKLLEDAGYPLEQSRRR